MFFLTCLFFLPAQIETVESTDFPKKLQVRAVTATVRIENPAKKTEGSGVIVGRTGPFVYILTAYHAVQDADNLEISTYSEQSYPKVEKVYRNVRVVAKLPDLRDLALVRIISEDKNLSVLPLCSATEIPKAESFAALACGCEEGKAPTSLANKVVGKKQVRLKLGGDAASFWEWPAAVAKGRSGGPLIDTHGRVIGICSGTSGGKGYFTHAQEIHVFLKKNAFHWLAEKEPAD